MKVTTIQTSGAYVATTSSGGRVHKTSSLSPAGMAADPAPVLTTDRAPNQSVASTKKNQDADLHRLVDVANDSLSTSDHHVQIEKHEGTGRFVMKLVDGNGEVVRQYPSEDFLNVSERLGELRGMLFASEG